jgi:hypothetical protein
MLLSVLESLCCCIESIGCEKFYDFLSAECEWERFCLEFADLLCWIEDLSRKVGIFPW